MYCTVLYYNVLSLTLGDFRIKHSELQLGRRVAGRRGGVAIHEGRWHGDVVIHSSSPKVGRLVDGGSAEKQSCI